MSKLLENNNIVSLQFESILLKLLSIKPNLRDSIIKGKNHIIYLYYSIKNNTDSKGIYLKLNLQWIENNKLSNNDSGKFIILSVYFYIIDNITGCKDLSGYFVKNSRNYTITDLKCNDEINIYVSTGITNFDNSLKIVGYNYMSIINLNILSEMLKDNYVVDDFIKEVIPVDNNFNIIDHKKEYIKFLDYIYKGGYE